MLLFFDFRVGRTARAGNVGLAFSMVLRIQVCHWCKIHLKRKHREESKEDKDHTNFHLLQSAEFCTWKFLFSYSLTRERVPKCAYFLAEREWGFSTPVKGRYFHFFFYYMFCCTGTQVSADVERCWHPRHKEALGEGQVINAVGAAI